MQGEATHDTGACTAALTRAFGLLGKRWNGIIIATLASQPKGFAELRRAVGGIGDSMLSERLAELTEAGIVHRRVDPGPPIAVDYELTESGVALLPALVAVRTWAETHLPGDGAPAGDS